MKFFNKLTISFISFMLGYFLHAFIYQSESLGEALSQLESIATIIGAILAGIAINSWRIQIKQNDIYSITKELEDALTKQLILGIDNESLIGKDEFKIYGSTIKATILKLKQREYQPKIIADLDACYRYTLSEIRETHRFTPELSKNLLEHLNKLSKAINNDFR